VARKPASKAAESAIDWRTLFTSLEGRIGRLPFWVGFLVLFLVGIPIQLFAVELAGDIAGLVISLAFLYPGFAVNVKRAHDRNRPAWLIGLFYVLVVVLVFMQIAGFATVEGQPTTLFVVVGVTIFLASIALLIDLGFLRGTPGKNPYGPDPLARK
jgi:uncharacterized membrane protein YhaH (DUF805 family)